MTVHRIHADPPALSAQALASFEAQFRYPLGEAGTFSVSHGEDYSRFYRSIGQPSWCYLAEDSGLVVGSLCLARQRVQTEGADTLLYLGDLKVLPRPDRGLVLRNLARAAMQEQDLSARAAYGVVMDGTAATPERYSGRVGIPAFRPCGKLSILRIDTGESVSAPPSAKGGEAADDAEGMACYRELAAGSIASLGGAPALRSRFPPAWLIAAGGGACGRLEDTLGAKRLVADSGELLSLHLACFAWTDPAAASQLLRRGLEIARERGYPAVFTSVDAGAGIELLPQLADLPVQISPATVFGFGLPPQARWTVHSSEI